ncbi:hypothetical protein SO694_00143049 [Aureococcus anophagefferens]|uniref:Uncharacterized protein n=1 Tax=Aureococcus anophagefferens TaxID=44056 RepID=A0ABR1FPK9_AURAN
MSEQHALCIDATRVAPAHLKSRGNQVDRMMDQLGKAVINWTEVLALVEPTAAITPTTTHFENKTIGWIEEYEQKIKDLDESFRGSNVFSMEVGHDALKMLDTNEKVFVEETKIFEKNAHLCVVFEFPEKINTPQEILQNALSIGGVGNLSACAEWEHPCSTRRRSECLAWDAEEYEVDEQNDLFMSEFLGVAGGAGHGHARKTDVANASSGYARSLVGVSQPPTIYVDESNALRGPSATTTTSTRRRRRRVRGALLPLGSRDDATGAGQTTRRPRARGARARDDVSHADIAPGSHVNAFEGLPRVPNAFEERQPSVSTQNRTADCVLGVDAVVVARAFASRRNFVARPETA